MPDIFDTLAPGAQPTAAQASPAQPNQPTGDIFDRIAPQGAQGPQSPLAPAPAPSSTSTPAPALQGDIFDQITAKQTTGAEPGGEGERMGAGESWLMRPVTTYLGIPEYREGAGPIERGAEKFASGLASPLNLGLMIVTGGLGSLAEGAGASALESLAPEMAAQVTRAAGAISKATNLGFTAQQIYGLTKSVPQIGDALKAGDTDKAIELMTGAALGTLAAGLATSHLVKSFGKPGDPIWTKDQSALGIQDHTLREHGVMADQFEKAHKDILNTPQDMAARLYHEAGGDTATLEKWRQEIAADKDIKTSVREKYDTLLKTAQALPDNMKQLSAELKQKYADFWKQEQMMGSAHPDSPGAPNYAGQHTYDVNDEGGNTLRYRGGPRRLTKRPGYLKNRVFDTIPEALHEGFEPKDVGLAGAHADYIRAFGGRRAIFLAEQELLRPNQLASDQRPIAVNPNKIIKVGNKTLAAIPPAAANTIDDALKFTHDGKQYLNITDYKSAPELFSRYRWLDESARTGKGIFQKEPLLIHPDYIDSVKAKWDDTSWFRKNPIMKNVLGLSTEAKKSLLSFSPFHWTTMALRGVQMGLNPMEALRPPEVTPESAVVRAKFGAKLSLEGERSRFAEGVSSNAPLVNKLPFGVGKFLTGVEEHLFGPNGYIDRLKAATFEKVAKQLGDRNPNWTTDQVHFATSQMVDAAYGGLNWKMLGASMNSVDALRLVALAPDFTGSQILFAKHLFQPGGSVLWQSLGRIALYNFGVAQALNLMTTGKVHPEHPFSVVSPDGKKTFNVRTMPGDIAHALTDPRRFVYNRLNPLVMRTGIEAVTGKDEQGKQVDAHKELLDLLRNVLPIASQSFMPSFQREGEGVGTGALRAVGIAPQPERSTASQMAGELASGHTPTGPVKPGQLAKHQTVIKLEDGMREGTLTHQDLSRAFENGDISPQQAKEISKNVQETKGMEPDMARLYTRAKRLPVDDMIEVMKVATPQERTILTPTFEKKAQRYFAENRNMTPQERASDRTYQLLRSMLPHLEPW